MSLGSHNLFRTFTVHLSRKMTLRDCRQNLAFLTAFYMRWSLHIKAIVRMPRPFSLIVLFISILQTKVRSGVFWKDSVL